MRCRKPGFFDGSDAQRGGDAGRALARVVEILEARALAADDDRQDPDRDGDRCDRMETDAAEHEDGRTEHHRVPAQEGAGHDMEDVGPPQAMGQEGDVGSPRGGGRGTRDAYGDVAAGEAPYGRSPSGVVQHDGAHDGRPEGATARGHKRGGDGRDTGGCIAPPTVRKCLDTAPEWRHGALGAAKDGPRSKVRLLSLFDGVGTAMLVVSELFTHMACVDSLARVWFVEREDHLAAPVAKHWADRGARGGPRFGRAAADVWDLLRNGGRKLAELLSDIAPGSLLIIIGGSPCQ